MQLRVSRLSLVATAAILAGILAAGCQRQREEARQQEQQREAQQAQQAQQEGIPGQPERVALDELEGHPDRFMGKTVTVEGEVDRVLGPNVFTIDERAWIDLEREMPVVVPESFAAIVRSHAPVRVTGTVERVPIAQVERRGGFLTDPKIRAEIQEKPALVVREMSTLEPATVAINLLVRPEAPVGTAGRADSAPVSDATQLSRAKDNNMVGRRVHLERATVSGSSEMGFWIRTTGGERIFVMPMDRMPLKEGQTASIQGIVLELPQGLREKMNATGEQIYIYADRVTPR